MQEPIDISFYRNYYDDMHDCDADQIISHWLRHGKAEGRLTSLNELIAKFADEGIHLPKDFECEQYLILNADVASKVVEPWQAIVHYLHNGIKEGRPYKVSFGATLSSEPYESSFAKSQAAARLEKVTEASQLTSDKFLSLFDHLDYRSLYSAEGLKTRADCVENFLSVGIKSLRSISIDLKFDASFYTSMYLESTLQSHLDAYVHWLNTGIERGYAPNERQFLKGLGLGQLGGFPKDFDPDLYSALNDSAPRFSSKWKALAHAIDVGIPNGFWLSQKSEELVDLYQAAADRRAVAGENDKAKPLYEYALLCDPKHPVALRHYGDCLLRLKHHYQALSVYKATIEHKADNIWTYLNAITCMESLGLTADAVAMASQVRIKFAADLNVNARAWDVAIRINEGFARRGHSLALQGYPAQARAQVALGHASLMHMLGDRGSFAPQTHTIDDVIIIADVGLAQCKFYRVDQKREQLKRGGVNVHVFDYTQDIPQLGEMISKTDLIILYRTPMTAMIAKIIDRARAGGVPTAFEIDDLMFEPLYFPESFESYDGQISQDLYATLITGSQSLTAVIQACDFSIASTNELGRFLSQKSGGRPVIVHRNALHYPHSARMSSREISFMDTQPRKICRIFYGTGTKAHNSDFDDLVAPALARLLYEGSPSIELIIVGFLNLPDILVPFSDRIELIAPTWDINAYWDILQECDINIAVLKDGAVTDCKSEIKWLEAAMFSIPSVLSPTAAYREVVQSGENALFADSPMEWYEQLKHLASHPSERTRIGSAAFDQVRTNYSSDQMSQTFKSQVIAAFDQLGVPVRKPTILIVNVFFPPQAIGGATRVVADNVVALKYIMGDRFDIEVYTTIEGGISPYEVTSYMWNGIKVTGITTPVDPNIDLVPFDKVMGDHFARYIRHLKPELIHFHCIQRLTTAVCSAALDAGVPYVVTVHDGWWISDSQFLIDQNGEESLYRPNSAEVNFSAAGASSIIRRRKLAYFLAKAEAVFSVSEQFGEIYRRCGVHKVSTVSNGVSPLNPKEKVRSSSKLRLGFIGGMSYHKGYHLLKAALFKSDFRNLTLTVIDHSLQKGVVNRSRWGGTEIVFKPKIPQSEVEVLYAELDVLIAPSIWPESYGLVVREAIQCGVWVVVSNRGALSMDVTSETGNVIDVDNDVDLLRVLAKMNASPDAFRPKTMSLNLRSSHDQANELALRYVDILEMQSEDDRAEQEHDSALMSFEIEVGKT